MTIVNNVSGKQLTIYAMIDSGADRDVVSASVVNELDIPTKLVQMKVITVDNSIIENRHLASFSLQSLDGGRFIDKRERHSTL